MNESQFWPALTPPFSACQAGPEPESRFMSRKEYVLLAEAEASTRVLNTAQTKHGMKRDCFEISCNIYLIHPDPRFSGMAKVGDYIFCEENVVLLSCRVGCCDAVIFPPLKSAL